MLLFCSCAWRCIDLSLARHITSAHTKVPARVLCKYTAHTLHFPPTALCLCASWQQAQKESQLMCARVSIFHVLFFAVLSEVFPSLCSSRNTNCRCCLRFSACLPHCFHRQPCGGFTPSTRSLHLDQFIRFLPIFHFISFYGSRRCPAMAHILPCDLCCGGGSCGFVSAWQPVGSASCSSRVQLSHPLLASVDCGCPQYSSAPQ